MSNTVRVLPVQLKYSGSTIDVDFRLVSDDGDTVATVGSVTVAPTGQLTSPLASGSGAIAKVWLIGGVDEADYLVSVPITTTLGRTEIGQVIVKVRD
jgi:hypothetical protein